MLAPRQPQKSPKQETLMEYSYTTSIALIIDAVSESTYQKIVDVLEEEREKITTLAKLMNLTQNEDLIEQEKIAKEYQNILQRLRKEGKSEVQMKEYTLIASLHLLSTAHNNFIIEKNKSSTLDEVH